MERPRHIINSINILSSIIRNRNNSLYKTVKSIKKIFNKHKVLEKEMNITYYGAGIAATNIAFALSVLNYGNVTMYDASLNEWAKDEGLLLSINKKLNFI